MSTNRDDILIAVAKGNPGALEFLRVFARRAHWIDDVADGDKLDAGARYGCHEIAKHESEWLLTLSSNQFFLAHRAQLVPAMVLALNAWEDSNKFTGTERDVIKGQWHEVVWLVAFLVGGTRHLQSVTSAWRSYDIEARGTENGCEVPVPCKCYRCDCSLPEWKYTVLIDGRPEAACSGCYNDWLTRPTRKELNGMPG